MDDRDSVLPLAPLVVRPAAPSPPGRPLSARVLDAVIAYLPVLLMAILALATWWLVKNTPEPPVERPNVPLVHEPDYEMSRFSVQRHTAQGPANSTIEGQWLQHFPDTDTLEIEGVRVRWLDAQGRTTVATARRAVAKADGSEVQLQGEARVARDGAGSGGPADAAPGEGGAGESFEFRSEYLQVFPDDQRVRTHRPVTVIQGDSEMRAGSLDYDHRTRVLELGGRVRGTLGQLQPARPPAVARESRDALRRSGTARQPRSGPAAPAS